MMLKVSFGSSNVVQLVKPVVCPFLGIEVTLPPVIISGFGSHS